MTTKEIRTKLERLKGQKEQIVKDIKTFKKRKKQAVSSIILHEKAKAILTEVGLKTQQEIQFHISDITSMALEAVFPDPYKLVLDFVQRRNKTECDIFFERDGNRIDPISASGGGAVDVAAFALRIASWSLQLPRVRNTIIMDEPFKHLKGEDANLKVLHMIRELSRQMKIQIIMVSDERISKSDIYSNADRIFEVGIKNGVSQVKTIEGNTY